ncbi:hypothetical protein L53_11600 [Hyphomonas sp. L-53-1-40]|uniref:HEPN domain-containing protein n=1 Tax=Hyphomonas sp. L-53-1-40 TaxID=1207058 RepID=UPI000458C4C3|nr:HEPN domain-containing protein [Hyphomonas sp. L-53-1-40]KCZ62299.1 hypothetical protein L53_11600 [Hyphomonas sp. L-53-1-40]
MTFVDNARYNLSLIVSTLGGTDMSALSMINEVGAKYLLVAAAGDLEQRTIGAIEHLFEQQQTPEHLRNFVKKKALERQFHTMFDWKSKSATSFFSLFGPAVKTKMAAFCKEDPHKEDLSAFLSIVAERNTMVHQGLAEYSLHYTLDEVYELYRRSLGFVNLIKIGLVNPDN